MVFMGECIFLVRNNAISLLKSTVFFENCFSPKTRLPDYPFSTEWWVFVGAQHATALRARRPWWRRGEGE